MLISETWRDASEQYIIGDSGEYEPDFDLPIDRDTFKRLERSSGRCTGKVYVDGKDGKAQHVGYVFVKRDKYEDTDETFLRETWITFHAEPTTVTRTPHFLNLAA